LNPLTTPSTGSSAANPARSTACASRRKSSGRGWGAVSPTLDNFIFPNFYSTADNNYSRYNNPEVDAAIDDARKIADEDERKDAYRKINQMVADDMPIIPIMFYAHQHVASDRVNELYYNAQGIADLGHASLRA